MSENIMWLEPRMITRNVPDNADLYISKGKKNKKNKIQTYFVFLNNSEKKITHEERLMVGFSQDRIYLRDAYHGCGYKLSKTFGKMGKNYSARLVISKDLDDIFTDGLYGSFKLQYSETNKMWFIAESGRLQ